MQKAPTSAPRIKTNDSMLITLAWLLLAIGGCLVAQSDPTAAASLASQGSAESSAIGPEFADAKPPTNSQRLFAAAAGQQQQFVVRRRRSSEQAWPANAPAPQQRHFSRHQQQKLAGDAAVSQQLAELIAQARNDKNFERTLLRMLINATLRSPAGAAAAAADSVDGAGAVEAPLGSAASFDQLLASAERAQRDEQDNALEHQVVGLIEYLEQRLKSSPGFVDQSSSVNSNDLGQLAVDTTGYGVDKREFKPCSFNAISCAKNPFRSS